MAETEAEKYEVLTKIGMLFRPSPGLMYSADTSQVKVRSASSERSAERMTALYVLHSYLCLYLTADMAPRFFVAKKYVTPACHKRSENSSRPSSIFYEAFAIPTLSPTTRRST